MSSLENKSGLFMANPLTPVAPNAPDLASLRAPEPTNATTKTKPTSHDPTRASDRVSPVVEVEVLERPYQIRCDRPELVSWISQLINEQIAIIRRQSLNSDLSDQDILVQLAFRLALSLRHGRQERESMLESIQIVESRIDDLFQALDQLSPLD
ncbi:MAG: cell division protein ZapA [Deltaproteobacteria bacterium]|jgi:cell division protein ZapA (FtsZ GTPase activity inhibitor)|nr:cell division protein ZapA [Deltaproteobacteria bacterium]